MEGMMLENDTFGKKWGELCQFSKTCLTFGVGPVVGSEIIAKVGARFAKNVPSSTLKKAMFLEDLILTHFLKKYPIEVNFLKLF